MTLAFKVGRTYSEKPDIYVADGFEEAINRSHGLFLEKKSNLF